MKLFYKMFHQDPESRDGIIAMTSGLGIFTNLLIAAVKVLVGLLSASIAIVSEGVNNASDALTSVLTLIGSRLARKHPDEKHPFGYGRLEYLTSLVISVLILVTGIELLKSSIELIFSPAELSISYISLAVVAFSAVLKFVLGTYTVKMGKKADSGALQALGLDSRNDSFCSLVTIVSALIFLIFHVSLDAYAGIFMSCIIIKAGIGVLRDTISELLGRPGEKELATDLYKTIRQTEGIVNAADMMLHNYGPDAWSGSVNVEIDHSKTVGEAYHILHALQLKIMHEQHVTMVFGIYAVDNDHEEVRAIRRAVAEFVKKHEHVISFHAVYLEPDTRRIYVDLTVDYKLPDWDALRTEFTGYMNGLYPDNELELTIETDFV